QLVHAHFGKKRGVYLGEVIDVRPDGVVVRLEAPVKPGDGVVFDAAQPEETEEGGRVYEVRSHALAHLRSGLNLLTFGRGDINLERVHTGNKVWKTSDPELERHLRRSFEGDTPKFQRPLTMEVHGSAGQGLTLLIRDELGHIVRLTSNVPLAHAHNQPLTT